MVYTIKRAWVSISRLARLLVEIDDILFEFEGFRNWSKGEELGEPEKKEIKVMILYFR